jgi:hypothetical protein
MSDNQPRDNYTDILLEELREHFRVVIEALADVQHHTRYIPEMRQDISRLRGDVETIKKAVTETNHKLRKQVTDHEHRITPLEAA